MKTVVSSTLLIDLYNRLNFVSKLSTGFWIQYVRDLLLMTSDWFNSYMDKVCNESSQPMHIMTNRNYIKIVSTGLLYLWRRTQRKFTGLSKHNGRHFCHLCKIFNGCNLPMQYDFCQFRLFVWIQKFSICNRNQNVI